MLSRPSYMDKLQKLGTIENFDVTFLVTLSLRSESPVQIRVTGAYSTGKVHPESHRYVFNGKTTAQLTRQTIDLNHWFQSAVTTTRETNQNVNHR